MSKWVGMDSTITGLSGQSTISVLLATLLTQSIIVIIPPL